jgi:hypothetical protein
MREFVEHQEHFKGERFHIRERKALQASVCIAGFGAEYLPQS